MNSFGINYRITIIGSSHGNLVGVLIDGIPAGNPINTDLIQVELSKRRPGQSSITTDRSELDKLIIETGIINGITTGEPILAYVRNKDIDSSYYDEIKETPRPGHADYPAYIKYKNAHDYRGGGRFSGRLTIALVIAGSIAQQIITKYNIEIYAYTKEISGIQATIDENNLDDDFIYSDNNPVRTIDGNQIDNMVKLIENVKSEGDSVGGIVECTIKNMPVGIGEPWFNSIESMISHIIYSIPAVKGIEFGSGFNAIKMKGSEHNDEYTIDNNNNIITKTNNAGGILGGLSNGMPIIFRVAFKPTSSIKKLQNTVDTEKLVKTELKVRGRHDPCIVPRAVPVVKNAASCVILDLLMSNCNQNQVNR